MNRGAGADADAAAEVLALPLLAGALVWPDTPAALLRARAAAWQMDAPCALQAEQSFRPQALALMRQGVDVAGLRLAHYRLVMVLPPRQREEARALLARAVELAAPGGRVLAAAANDEGARSFESDLASLAGPLQTQSKHHCRVFWSDALDAARLDREHLAAWRALDAPRPIAGGRFQSRPGVFAWDRIDPASALLADCLTPDLGGRAADLGCGWGFLGSELLTRCAGIEALDSFEAEARALELARVNLAGFAPRVRLGWHWWDVHEGLPGGYDLILSNPPFHQGRASEPALGQAFIAAAAAALRPGGRLLLVANAHLPYEAILRRCFARVRSLRNQHGFKVFEAIR